MSIELVKRQIKHFVESTEPEVLAIKGPWGVGKTYSWNKFLKEYKAEVGLNAYSYVSLFGLNSIEEIKRAVFENTVDTINIGEKPDLKTFKKNYQSIAKQVSRKSMSALRGISIPFVGEYVEGLGSVFTSLSYLSLNKTIICFDDLERHGQDLRIKDFLGLVSYFKEQKDCKVVLLLNENADKEATDEFSEYKEKVIDKQLCFSPTSHESFNLALDNTQGNPKWNNLLKECCIKLDIKNIRVIRKIQYHTTSLLSLIESHDDSIKSQLIHSVTLLSWSYYCCKGDNLVPDFRFIKNAGTTKIAKEYEEKDCQQWNDILAAYGYKRTDMIDLAIADSIENGFPDENRWLELCNAKQSEIMSMKRADELSKAWGIYHGSFDDNGDEVANAFDKALRASILDVTTHQWSQPLIILRKIGFEEKADTLIQFYLDTFRESPERFNIDSHYHTFDIEDSKFENALRQAYNDHKKEDSPRLILDRWKGSSSWNSEDAHVLAKLSKEELKEMFKQFKGEELTLYIRACIKLGQSSEILMKNTQEALEEIGNENALNRSRLAKFRR
ncbi:KAP family NTPase [Parasalinivibrio latis]|uniref:P-loop NTPase fold protein n=1 Tax=Parasalinivibrio latis TaxID=2952610 RepID=UPI0030E39B18